MAVEEEEGAVARRFRVCELDAEVVVSVTVVVAMMTTKVKAVLRGLRESVVILSSFLCRVLKNTESVGRTIMTDDFHGLDFVQSNLNSESCFF